MKNEKLELLLNKVVAFDQPEVSYYKGFLYKDGRGYYIKVVESTLGSFFLNDKIYLKDGDEQYITHADKPKLMRVSLKSWHYRLIKYILRDNAPTPKTMQNGCPYFWLLVLSMIALPFVLLGKGLKFTVLLIPKLLFWCLEKFIDLWIQSVDDVMAYDIYWKSYEGNSKLPVTAKIYFSKSDNDFYEYFINEKYGLSYKKNPEEYEKKKLEISAKWEEFRQEREEKRQKERTEAYERSRKENERVARIMAKREANKKVWDARMKPINNGFSALFTSIGKVFVAIYNTFKFSADWKVLIRRTKQVVGAIITLIVLAGTYLVVNFIAYALIAFVDFSIANWEIYAALGFIAVAGGIIYILGVVVGSWIQNIVNKYERGKRVWYIEGLVYGLWYPVKYIGLFLAYAVVYVLWIPVKFIFYTFLWKIVLVNVGIFLWRVICSFGKGLANSTGVFGEYFGASYSDYCPGIEWTDVEDEK